MKTLKIGDKEYTLEFSFEAAGHKACIDKIFKMISGGYIAQQGVFGDKSESKAELASALINGASAMHAELPDTVITAFYAGLLEGNSVLNVQTAKNLLKQYFKENPDDKTATYPGMYELIRQCMEDDGFFKLTGLDRVMKEMTGTVMQNETMSESEKNPPKTGKKLTSVK